MRELSLEVVVVPVSDVDKAKAFYETNLGCRLDADFVAGEDFRVVQVTPPGSGCSIIFGKGLSSAVPGSTDSLQLIVDDIESVRGELLGRGVEVSEVFHDVGGVFHHAGTVGRVTGPASDHKSYGSFASFNDPDGNIWYLQEVTTRLPGRIESSDTTFDSAGELASALRRAAAAHGEHEKRIGKEDPDWTNWYAEYMARERAGEMLPE